MTITDFKAMIGATSLDFFKSNKTGRFVASHGETRLITVDGFDPSQPSQVVENDPDATQIQDTNLFWLTNKKATAAFSL